MEYLTALNALHRRYDGPIPSEEDHVARFGSMGRYERAHARAMAARLGAEYARILEELWRHEREHAFIGRFPVQDRLRDLRFYRRRRLAWERRVREIPAGPPLSRQS